MVVGGAAILPTHPAPLPPLVRGAEGGVGGGGGRLCPPSCRMGCQPFQGLTRALDTRTTRSRPAALAASATRPTARSSTSAGRASLAADAANTAARAPARAEVTDAASVTSPLTTLLGCRGEGGRGTAGGGWVQGGRGTAGGRWVEGLRGTAGGQRAAGAAWPAAAASPIPHCPLPDATRPYLQAVAVAKSGSILGGVTHDGTRRRPSGQQAVHHSRARAPAGPKDDHWFGGHCGCVGSVVAARSGV